MDYKNKILHKSYLIDDYLEQNFNQVYDFKFKGQLYLVGGAVKDILIGKEPKDLDFVILSYRESNIKDFINKHEFNYNQNSFGGYKLLYNFLKIDMWQTNDLFKIVKYNLDGLFYDVVNKQIISFGFIDGIENNELIEINSSLSHPNKNREIERNNKLKEYLK